MKRLLFRISTLMVAVLFIATMWVGCRKEDDEDISSDLPQSNVSSEMPSSKETSSEVSSEETSSEENLPVIATPIDGKSINLADLEQYENEKKGWGQGRQVDQQNRPISCNQYQEKYGENGGLFIMPKEEKVMYLTFDEGYENGYTTKILDALKEKDCKAVFFVTMPYVKQNPDLIKRMIDEGHMVGNHSVNHKSMPTLDGETAIQEIADLHNYMVEEYNYHMTLFRPPMGEWSTRTLEIAKQLGYQSVFWSYAYLDYDVKNQMGVEKAFPKVTEAAHNGAIYLLHAVSTDNADMMADLIDNFREQGYSLELLEKQE